MSKLTIYKIKTEYIEYLRQFDTNVCFPKESSRVRPYVGVLALETDDFYYFAPLTSETNKPDFYCVKLYNNRDEAIASVRINNMIPIYKKNINCYSIYEYSSLVSSSNDADKKYGHLLKAECESLGTKEKQDLIKSKANYFYRNYMFNENIRRISTNFFLLEDEAKNYQN